LSVKNGLYAIVMFFLNILGYVLDVG